MEAIRGRSVVVYVKEGGGLEQKAQKEKKKTRSWGKLVVRVKSRKVRIRKKKRKERLMLESRRRGVKREGEGKEAEMKVDLITTFSGWQK